MGIFYLVLTKFPIKSLITLQSNQEVIQNEAENLFNEGYQLFQQGTAESLQQAIVKFQKSYILYHKISNIIGGAATLSNLANIYSDLGEKQKALDYYQQALSLWKAGKNLSEEAMTLNNIGVIYNDLGEKQKALRYYQQALPLWKAEKNLSGKAITISSIGAAYSDLGENQKALRYNQQALSLWKAEKNRSGEANALHNIGVIYDDLGEKQKALRYYQQALFLWKAEKNLSGEASTLNGIGVIYDDLGKYSEALKYYQHALSLYKPVIDRSKEADTFNNIGIVYHKLGEYSEALKYYKQSLSLNKAVGNRFKEATTLNNVGISFSDLGDKQKALDYYQQALLLQKTFGYRSGEAGTLNNIGSLYSYLGDKQKALVNFNQALILSIQVGDRTGQATTLNDIGSIYLYLGDKQKALDNFNQALAIFRQIGDRPSEAKSLYNIAGTHKSQGNLQNALTNIKEAIAIIEKLRINIASQDLRTSYFATVQDYYKFYIELLMELHQQNPSAGYNITAFEVSEQARARGLIDLLNEANADIRKDINPQLKEKEQQLLSKLRSKTQYQLQLTQGKYSEEQLKTIKREIADITTQLQQVEGEIRTQNPRYAEISQPENIKLKNLKDIQQQLDQDTVLLSYWLGEKESYFWVITPKSLTSYTLANKKEIETLANEFKNLIADSSKSNRRKTTAQKAFQLTDKLLAPAKSQLTNKRLIIVPDGGLQYIPFNSLASLNSTPKTFKPLIFDHEIVNLPSASVIIGIRENMAKRPANQKTLAVLADPVFTANDPRITNNNSVPNNRNFNNNNPTNNNSVQNNLKQNNLLSSLTLERLTRSFPTRDGKLVFDRLQGTRKEAENILKLVPNSDSKKFLDFDANLTAINNPELSKYRFILLATHGFLNGINPELSGIVLSLVNEKGEQQDGLLMTPDIFNLNLPADLIVLSACESGLGKDVKGEGIVGLTRGFMYAGTSRLMLSLWKVNDEMTAELMTRFYKGILQENLTPAQALRKAQLSMWEEGNAPYYWSAFILQGEWR
ncbi:MAG: tetratricopeptide repeat protein [Geminocystis sp. GBBB08]|nr:tetratricopeptide repeat protein [Geminocystis sp. GBBB08]